VAEPDRAVPDHVLDSVAGLLDPYVTPRRDGEWWVCADHRARASATAAGDVVLQLEHARGPGSIEARRSDAGPPVTAVRAGLAALLAVRDRPGADVAALARAARALDGPED
jgi:hypothetical protein